MAKPVIIYPGAPIEEPLTKVVGERSKEFLFVGMVDTGKTWVFIYKHLKTLHCLNLDDAGRAYLYDKGKYTPQELPRALEKFN